MTRNNPLKNDHILQEVDEPGPEHALDFDVCGDIVLCMSQMDISASDPPRRLLILSKLNSAAQTFPFLAGACFPTSVLTFPSASMTKWDEAEPNKGISID